MKTKSEYNHFRAIQDRIRYERQHGGVSEGTKRAGRCAYFYATGRFPSRRCSTPEGLAEIMIERLKARRSK